MFKIYILYEQCTSVHLDVHACIIINEHTDLRHVCFHIFLTGKLKAEAARGEQATVMNELTAVYTM